MSQYFKVSGEKLERKFDSCPNCGPGFFMGKHKDRKVCGNCGHTEFTKKGKKK